MFHWWQQCLTLVNLPWVTSIWRIDQTFPLRHFHLLHCKLDPGRWVIFTCHDGFHYFIYRWFWWSCIFMLPFHLLLEAVPLSYCAQKVLKGVGTYWPILIWSYWFGCLEWKVSHLKHIVVGSIIMKFIHEVSFVSLLCWHFSLEFVVVVCTFEMKVGSSALVAWACLLHSFNFINTLCLWGTEFSSAITLWSFIPCANITNISEAPLHYLPLDASMSNHAIFQLPTVETIDYCIVATASHWNYRHVRSVVHVWKMLAHSV